jgi:hypothetical protein
MQMGVKRFFEVVSKVNSELIRLKIKLFGF